MPVIDRKPVCTDNDDEHYTKLVPREHKNDTMMLHKSASIPIGSTVVVQQEDGGPWTHGTIIRMGDYNHHNCTYNIQITTMGRRITCNKQHNRLMPIAAEDYICYQTK